MIPRIGIVHKHNQPQAVRIITELLPWLQDRHVQVVLEQDDSFAGQRVRLSPREAIPGQVDVLVVFGGDGTLLSAARLPQADRVPFLAVNLGGLGFLTDVRIDEIYAMLERVLSGAYSIDHRMMLDVCVQRAGDAHSGQYLVLNDVVVNKTALARMVELDVFVNDTLLNTFFADGLIISTPTGSTGYSLSAGGPIIYPSLHVISLTPICPHTLTNRPIILPDMSDIRVSIRERFEDVYVTMDGQVGVGMKEGMVRVVKSERVLSLIRTPFRTYFDTLKEKLNWGRR